MNLRDAFEHFARIIREILDKVNALLDQAVEAEAAGHLEQAEHLFRQAVTAEVGLRGVEYSMANLA